MKLLLDEMHAPAVAIELCERGHDVVAIAAGGDLRGMPDDEVFARAAVLERAIVTETVVDFVPLTQTSTAEGRAHPGLVLTSPRRFVRADRAYPGDLISALDRFLSEPPITGHSWVWWLR